jgi:hypothetical protein
VTLITIQPGEIRQIIYQAAGQRVSPFTIYTIANLDETGTIFVGPGDADHQAPDLTSPGAASQLVALQAITVSTDQDWYAYNPSGGLFNNVFSNTFTGAPITVDILPNVQAWSPSPYQSALSLLDQGLMKDSTGQSVLTQTGDTATNTGTALTMGVPPGVPNVTSSSQLFGNYTGSPYTLYTFPSAGRLWGASLSLAISTNNSYSGATTNVYALLKTGSGTILEIVELAVTAANDTQNGHGDLALNGVDVSAGDTLILDVNNASGITNAVMRASGFVLHSIP